MILACIEHHTRQFVEAVKRQITEAATGFTEYESGDYLRCAGADALAESLPMATFDNGPHYPDDESVCYFCDRPTDRIDLSDDVSTAMVCARCYEVATASAASPHAADDPAAEVSDGLIPPMAPPVPAGSLTWPEQPLLHQKAEGCWCGEHLNAEGTESAVLMACSHFRIAHCHRQPIETGLDMGASMASEFFPQSQKHPK